MKDDLKKLQAFVENEFRRVLQGYIGQKPDPKAVERTINDTLDRLKPNKSIPVAVDVEVVGDSIRAKLRQPSFINQILPVLERPLVPWAQGGLVHLAGRLGDFTVIVCTYNQIEPGSFSTTDLVLTCLACIAHGE